MGNAESEKGLNGMGEGNYLNALASRLRETVRRVREETPSDVARRITYLDTADSLAVEVKWFDGRNHGWENEFWNAIQHSSEPQEALRLITSRMQESDFQASTSVLEWLASLELRLEVPEAFQSSTPASYHAQAVEMLRKYVRLLGNSLSTST